MHVVGALDEGIDEGGRDVVEHRSDQTFEYGPSELVAQIEHDLAGSRCERLEMPGAVELTKRPIAQLDDDELGPLVTVGGREVRPYPVIIDVDPHN